MLRLFMKWLGMSKEEVVGGMELPVREVSIDEVRLAVVKFTKQKPEGVHLSVLIKDNLEIDYSLLIPYLQAIPKQTYYMSKETYEIFDEPTMPRILDNIQKAVDHYIDTVGKFPIVEGNSDMKVCYFKLKPYLNDIPSFETYLTAEENLITRKKPVYH